MEIGERERKSGAVTAVKEERERTVDDVWADIVSGKFEFTKKEAPEDDVVMTLEEFLVRAETAEAEAVKPAVELMPLSQFGNEGGERQRRRAVYEVLDMAAQKRQRQMIRNREAATRSRDRKQAYQAELEALAVKLEEENQKLLKEKAERIKKRLQQLMEKVVPVEKKHKPPRVLRRVHSAPH